MASDSELHELMQEFLVSVRAVQRLEANGAKDRDKLRDEIRQLEVRFASLETKLAVTFGANGGGILTMEKRMTSLERGAEAAAKVDQQTAQVLEKIGAKMGAIWGAVATILTNLVWLLGKWLTQS